MEKHFVPIVVTIGYIQIQCGYYKYCKFHLKFQPRP